MQSGAVCTFVGKLWFCDVMYFDDDKVEIKISQGVVYDLI